MSDSTMTDSGCSCGCAAAAAKAEAKTLRWLLAINAAMFVVEIVAGWLAQSTGLIADSLDMFADATVYGLALYAVGHAGRQLHAARLSGWLQLLLALGVLGEVLRRWLTGSAPEPLPMMGIALLALAANVACMVLLAKHREGGAHMRASWIFSTNDVLANLGVILAGALVAWSGSNVPDLVIGTLIGLLVLNGARRILGLKA
jgi:Co/Zn/Cd efflux system component